MKKLLVVGFALGALIAPAGAADIQIKAPLYTKARPPAPVYRWTGFYAGLNAGGGWTSDGGSPRCFDPAGINNGPLCQNVPANTIDGSGFIGGGQIGYNWQINPGWVVGLETDFQGSNISGSTTIKGPFTFFGGGLAASAATFTASEKLDWLGTVRGRLGITAGRAFFYATGGLAYGEVALNTNLVAPAFTFPGTTTVTKVGWTAGGGIESAFAGNRSAKVEGLFYDLGTTTVLAGPVLGAGVPGIAGFLRGKNFDVQGSIVRAGINFKFGSDGPVGAL